MDESSYQQRTAIDTFIHHSDDYYINTPTFAEIVPLSNRFANPNNNSDTHNTTWSSTLGHVPSTGSCAAAGTTGANNAQQQNQRHHHQRHSSRVKQRNASATQIGVAASASATQQNPIHNTSGNIKSRVLNGRGETVALLTPPTMTSDGHVGHQHQQRQVQERHGCLSGNSPHESGASQRVTESSSLEITRESSGMQEAGFKMATGRNSSAANGYRNNDDSLNQNSTTTSTSSSLQNSSNSDGITLETANVYPTSSGTHAAQLTNYLVPAHFLDQMNNPHLSASATLASHNRTHNTAEVPHPHFGQKHQPAPPRHTHNSQSFDQRQQAAANAFIPRLASDFQRNVLSAVAQNAKTGCGQNARESSFQFQAGATELRADYGGQYGSPPGYAQHHPLLLDNLVGDDCAAAAAAGGAYGVHQPVVGHEPTGNTIPKFYSSITASTQSRKGPTTGHHIGAYLEPAKQKSKFCSSKYLKSLCCRCSKNYVYSGIMLCLMLFLLQLAVIVAITLGYIKLPGGESESSVGTANSSDVDTRNDAVDDRGMQRGGAETATFGVTGPTDTISQGAEQLDENKSIVTYESMNPVDFYEDIDFSQYYDFNNPRGSKNSMDDETDVYELGPWSEWTSCTDPCHERTRTRTCGKSCIDNTSESCHYSMSMPECKEDTEMRRLAQAKTQRHSDRPKSPDSSKATATTAQNDQGSPKSEAMARAVREKFGRATDSCQEWLRLDRTLLKRRREDMNNLPSCPCRFPQIDGSDMKASVRIQQVRWLITNTQEPLPGVDDNEQDQSYEYDIDADKTRKLSTAQVGINFVDTRLIDASVDLELETDPTVGKDKSGEEARQERGDQTVKCIRSVPPEDRTLKSSNTCCYGSLTNKLITRGPAAGMPSLISPDYNYTMHYKYDVLPYLYCHGNWLMYHKFRPPNNGNQCEQFPNRRVYRKLKKQLRNEYV